MESDNCLINNVNIDNVLVFKTRLRNKILQNRKKTKQLDRFVENNHIFDNVQKIISIIESDFKKSNIDQNDFKLDSFRDIKVNLQNKMMIGLYWPIAGEPDLLKLVVYSKYITSIPKTKGQKFNFVRYDMGTSVERGFCNGLMHPINNTVLIPDVVIVPGLAFSLSGFRLGFGHGHYDKYLAKISSKKNIIKIGVCFDEYLYEYLPYKYHDIKLDYVVTDKIIIKI